MDYDEKGREIRNSRSFRTADDRQERRQEILRTYGSDDKMLRQEIATYDAADEEEYRTIEAYNDQNQMTDRTTVHKDFTQVVTYTYDQNSRVIEEMSVITPAEKEGTDSTEEPVIDYRKTTFEYYESGEKKRQSTQYWTSEDEKNAEPGTAQSELGSTVVTEFNG